MVLGSADCMAVLADAVVVNGGAADEATLADLSCSRRQITDRGEIHRSPTEDSIRG